MSSAPFGEAEMDAALGHRDPVTVLMEWGQLRDLNVTYSDPKRTGPDHRSRFHVQALMGGNGRQWGSGSSKNEARKMAARNTLRQLYLSARTQLLKPACLALPGETEGEETRASRYQRLAHHVMQMAEATQLVHLSRDKVFAAVIMEDLEQTRVVSLGTGNRVIHPSHVTEDLRRLVDGHAEVVARRAFLRFLYGQLERHAEGKVSILTNSTIRKGRLAVRPDVTFHLYVSRPPCGDAAAFPTIGSRPGRRCARLRQGQLRTKLADGEGSIPTETADSGRLRVMTCSDKILRWNALGIQGGLLSALLDPVYLQSIVIGSYVGTQNEHVRRGLGTRLSGLTLTSPFGPNLPEVIVLPGDPLPHSRMVKAREFAVGWTLGDPAVEVIQVPTGSAVTCISPPGTSRLSTLTLFQRFLRLTCGHGEPQTDPCDVKAALILPHMTHLHSTDSELPLCVQYRCTKDALSPEYQRAKTVFMKHLKARRLGQWHSTLRHVLARPSPHDPC